jgi:hypothetical protein
MPKYRIHFADGHTVEKEAGDGTVAKTMAKQEVRREHGVDDASDPRIRVVRVEDLTAS